MVMSRARVKRPYIKASDLDNEARRFLQDLYPTALYYPINVPVVQIAAEMGVTIISHLLLSEDFSIYGIMCFSDGEVDVFDETTGYYTSLQVKAGTMLIDPRTKFDRNIGCFNNTVAHELFHWYRHRDYFQSLDVGYGLAVIATRCTLAQVDGETSFIKESDLDWIEWQATSIAPRILMPRESFEMVAYKSINNYKGCFRTGNQYLHQVITDVVSEFRVSRQSACIRLKEAGLMPYFSK